MPAVHGDEVRRLLHQVRGEGRGTRGVVVRAQVDRLAALPGSVRPHEAGAGFQVVAVVVAFAHHGVRRAHFELRVARLDEGRPERDVLGPGNRAVEDGQVLHRFVEQNLVGAELQSTLKRQVRRLDGGPHDERFPIHLGSVGIDRTPRRAPSGRHGPLRATAGRTHRGRDCGP